MKRHDIIKAKCIDLTYEGKGVVKINNFPIFVNGLFVGEEADIEIDYLHEDFGFGKIKKLYNLSKDRIEPKCKVCTACGGCQFQQLSYEAELDFKTDRVRNDLKRIGNITNDVLPTIGMEEPYFYRNKVQVPVRLDKRRNIISGFYKENSHDIVVVDKCYIENEDAENILSLIKKLMKDMRIEPYNEDTRKGVIRHILIRTSYHYDEIMVTLVTAVDSFKNRNELSKAITKAYPKVTTVVQNINDRKTNVILGEREKILYGSGYIKDSILGIKFNISSKSFYQINPVQVEKLYQNAINLLDFQGNERVLDAYCGIGTIGLIVSKHVKEVVGVEIVKEAIKDAIKNAKNNDIKNAIFYQDDASDYINRLDEKEKFDVVIMDPPRKGSDDKFLNAVLKMEPKKIAYISCNPATLARDLRVLLKKYDITTIQPVDMFPRTCHVETVVALVLKK